MRGVKTRVMNALAGRRCSATPPTARAQGTSEGADAPTAPPPPSTTRLHFSVPYRTEFGHHIAVVGSHPALGEWNPAAARPLEWTDGDAWVLTLELEHDGGAPSPSSPSPPPSPAWEYKYVVRDGRGASLRWSEGDNFALPPLRAASARGPAAATTVTVADAWDGARHDVSIETVEGGGGDGVEGAGDVRLPAAGGAPAPAACAAGEEGVDHRPPCTTTRAAARAAEELAAALAASAEAVAVFGPASKAALEADARVAAAEAAVRAASAVE